MMNAYMILDFEKKYINNFKKVFDLSDFSKIRKSWDVTGMDLPVTDLPYV